MIRNAAARHAQRQCKGQGTHDRTVMAVPWQPSPQQLFQDVSGIHHSAHLRAHTMPKCKGCHTFNARNISACIRKFHEHSMGRW
jgi:hypothetical protein